MNRKELVKKKFPDHYESALAITDPSGNDKYLLWIAAQLKNKHNVPDIVSTIEFFHENPARFAEKDINKYKDLKDLENLIKEFGLSNRQEKAKNKEGSKKIFESDNLSVIRVDDKQAMIAYGANTKWCTTMKDQSYYENYVADGNSFYIIIYKIKPQNVKTEKYAVCRKGLLEFQVYDDKDSYARSFSDDEVKLLRDPVQAIVADDPPPNIIFQIVKNKISNEETIEWLNTQTQITKDWVYQRCQHLKFISKSSKELVELFKNNWERRHIPSLSYENHSGMAEYMAKNCSDDKDHYPTKTILISLLKEKELELFKDDKDVRIRSLIASKLPNSSKDFMNDRAITVFKSAARVTDPENIFEFMNSTKSSRKKQAANEVIIERISQDKVRKFILGQDEQVIKSLMV